MHNKLLVDIIACVTVISKFRTAFMLRICLKQGQKLTKCTQLSKILCYKASFRVDFELQTNEYSSKQRKNVTEKTSYL